MNQRKKRVNPFYVVLVIAGVAFVVTACAYGVMAVKQMHVSYVPVEQVQADASFVGFMDEHGATVMMIELAVLGVATFAAMGTDRFWTGES